MERVANLERFPAVSRDSASAARFAVISAGFVALAACMAGWLPVQFSIVTVFLFAGPHNWIEFRYFLSRMPARWGTARNFLLAAIAGAILLTIGYAGLPHVASAYDWPVDRWAAGTSVWNTALVLWVAGLVMLRARESSRRNGFWALAAAACAVSSVAWMEPDLFGIALVYLHPLIALWFLDRLLRRSRPEWLRAFHIVLGVMALSVLVLWGGLAASPSLPGNDALTIRITYHAGAGVLGGISTHLLVSTHVFLEMAHYGVWLVAIPIVGLRTRPWRTDRIPLATHPRGFPRLVKGALAFGAFAVVLLWACFLLDYSTTRDVYFTVAMLHVLGEAPFLIRMF